jgi:hypothetical protein
MNTIGKTGILTLLAAGMLYSSVAPALEIWRFDQMADDDQIAYVSALEESVKSAMPAAQLPRLKRFFQKKQPGEVISGMGQFEMNLSMARLADVQARDKNPKVRRLDVDDVMYVTLERNGIALTEGFRPAAAQFKPTRPLSGKIVSRQDADKALAETRTWVARSVPGNNSAMPDAAPTLSGFSSLDKGVAFFVGLIALAKAADEASGGALTKSAASAPGYVAPANSGLWWENQGYTSYGQAVRAICLANTTSAHPNC